MTIRIMTVALTVLQVLIGSTPLFAQAKFGSFTPADRRAFHACLYAHYIADYCRFRAWGVDYYSFADCVIANGACECVVTQGGYWDGEVDEACRSVYWHSSAYRRHQHM